MYPPCQRVAMYSWKAVRMKSKDDDRRYWKSENLNSPKSRERPWLRLIEASRFLRQSRNAKKFEGQLQKPSTALQKYSWDFSLLMATPNRIILVRLLSSDAIRN